MKELIALFSKQLREAITIGESTLLPSPTLSFSQIVVSGLGGSGIGASIVQEYVYDSLSIPFTVNKNYFIPASTDANTLFIACSYSGNTEETLMAVKDAKKRNATIVCITSGGELASFAKKNNFPLFLIPSGMPPRACLGYSLVQLLFVLNRYKLIKLAVRKEIESAASMLDVETKKVQKQAQKISAQLVGKQIAIYGMAGAEGLAIRFRQQLNENSKVLCWHHVVPEMTHNEIVGWKHERPDMAVLFCYHAGDYERNIRRMGVLKKVVKQCKATCIDIEAKGATYWQRVFFFIHLSDWVSVFLADAYQHDAVEVKVIDKLKSEMSKK